MFLALGEMTGKKIDQDALTKGLRADGVGTFIGGIFNTFPYTSFSQNVGLVGVTGIRSRWVCLRRRDHAAPRPAAEDGGAGGGRSAGGAGRRRSCDVRHGGGDRRAHPHLGRFQEQPVQSVRGRDLGWLRHDPAGGAEFLQALPHGLHPLLESGILLAAIVAVALNAFFNGLGSTEEARAEASASAHAAEHA